MIGAKCLDMNQCCITRPFPPHLVLGEGPSEPMIILGKGGKNSLVCISLTNPLMIQPDEISIEGPSMKTHHILGTLSINGHLVLHSYSCTYNLGGRSLWSLDCFARSLCH